MTVIRSQPAPASARPAEPTTVGPTRSGDPGHAPKPLHAFEPDPRAITTIDAGGASAAQGGAAPGATTALTRLSVPGDALAQALEHAVKHVTAEGLQIVDQLLALPRQHGLIPMNIANENGAAVVRDGSNSALDAARTTRGLAELALSIAEEHPEKARAYARAAALNWQATREHLRTENGTPIHLQTFGEGTKIGENTTDRRVNADGLYPASDSAAMLMLAEGLGGRSRLDAHVYRQALVEDTTRFIRDFYQPKVGTFVYHADAITGSHAERETKGDVEHRYPHGVVGNDGTVYGLAALLIPTLRALGAEADSIPVPSGSFTQLVREQMDLISDGFTFVSGAMWETYGVNDDGSLEPIRFAWQDQPVEPPVTLPDGSVISRSHVAIGGHTVMAAGQLAEGALELHRLGKLTDAERDRYLARAVSIVQGAIDHGIIDVNTGVVHNANMLEVPVEHVDARTKPGGNDWGEAAWQQRELMQTLLVLRKARRLRHLTGPSGPIGEQLLTASLRAVTTDFAAPNPITSGFGGEWVYHGPQAAAYLRELA